MSMGDALMSSDHRALVGGIDAVCGRIVDDDYLLNIDRSAEYPFAVMNALADAGWASMAVPSEDGASAADLAVVHEALARHSLAIGQAYFSMWVLGAEVIHRLGSEEQKSEWLPRIAGGARVAFALTEPGSGSDAAALTTTARIDGQHYSVSGQKVFITGAAVADVIVTAVRTGKGPSKRDGITLLLVDPKGAGVTIERTAKIGLKAIDLCEVFLADVTVSQDAVLGVVNEGWAGLHPGLARERLYLAALSVGALHDLLDRCLAYAQERTAFRKSLGSHQLIAQKIVEMRVALESARALVSSAARMVDEGAQDAVTFASIAKLQATRSYVSAAREAVQIFGGYGFTDDFPVSRHYRDCKYLEIGGGTSEIQTIVIARAMGLQL
jgi:alkylation response protein AidB-like acyl-CoA dehydrogenase